MAALPCFPASPSSAALASSPSPTSITSSWPTHLSTTTSSTRGISQSIPALHPASCRTHPCPYKWRRSADEVFGLHRPKNWMPGPRECQIKPWAHAWHDYLEDKAARDSGSELSFDDKRFSDDLDFVLAGFEKESIHRRATVVDPHQLARFYRRRSRFCVHLESLLQTVRSRMRSRKDSAMSSADETPKEGNIVIVKVPSDLHKPRCDEDMLVMAEDFGSPLTRSRAHSGDEDFGTSEAVTERDVECDAVHREHAHAQPVAQLAEPSVRQASLKLQTSSFERDLSLLERAVQRAEHSGRFRGRSRTLWCHPDLSMAREQQREASESLRAEAERARREWDQEFWMRHGFYRQRERRMQMNGEFSSSELNLDMYGMML